MMGMGLTQKYGSLDYNGTEKICECMYLSICLSMNLIELQHSGPLYCLKKAVQKTRIIFHTNLSWGDMRSIKLRVFFSPTPPPLSSLLSILMVEGHPSKTHNGARRWMRAFVGSCLDLVLKMWWGLRVRFSSLNVPSKPSCAHEYMKWEVHWSHKYFLWCNFPFRPATTSHYSKRVCRIFSNLSMHHLFWDVQ